MDMANTYKIAIENERFTVLDRLKKFLKVSFL
jgi:hypothetical protein